MTFSCKVLLIIIIIIVVHSLRLFSAMDICKEKDKPNFKLKLLGTALFKDYLLLITRDDLNYTVYKISFDNFGNSYGQMYIGAAGVPIEQYWPLFKSAPEWAEMRPNVVSFWLIDKVKPYLYFIVPEGKTGYGLDVENSKWTGSVKWKLHRNIATQWIANSDASHTYTNKINDELHGIYLLYVWNITLSEKGENVQGIPHEASHLYYSENKRTKQVENITFMYNYNHGVDSFVSPESDPYLKMPGYEDYRLVNLSDWSLSPDFVPPGFIFKEHFHMFSHDKVFIFADRLTYEDPGLELGQIWYTTPVKAVLYKDFFTCDMSKMIHVSYPPVGPPVTADNATREEERGKLPGSSLTWLWVLLVILLGLLLILVPLWMCYRRKKSKTKGHQSDKKGSTHSRKSSGKHKSSRKHKSSGKHKSSNKHKSSDKHKSSSKHKNSRTKGSRGTRSSARKAK